MRLLRFSDVSAPEHIVWPNVPSSNFEYNIEQRWGGEHIFSPINKVTD